MERNHVVGQDLKSVLCRRFLGTRASATERADDYRVDQGRSQSEHRGRGKATDAGTDADQAIDEHEKLGACFRSLPNRYVA